MKIVFLIIMKHIFFILVTFILLLSCSPKTVVQQQQGIKAKIIRITCASAVIQILDKNYYSLAEDWTEKGTENTIPNAVSVSNKCDIPQNLKNGDEFYFELASKENTNQLCIVCKMMDYPPKKSIYIKVK
jgi:hypothetical protein